MKLGKLSKMIFVIAIISMELQGAAPIGGPGGVEYTSAGVIPVEKCSSERRFWDVFFFQYHKKEVGANLWHHDEPDNLFTDLSARKKPGEHDPAVTAARALFPHQKQFTRRDQLEEHLRRSPRIDINGHVVYIAAFDEGRLENSPKSAWKVLFKDFIDAARRNFKYTGAPGKDAIHDPSGVFVVLYPPLARGLATDAAIRILEEFARIQN